MLTWLPDVLRAAGLTVIEVDGWETRGADRITVKGVVVHHTASGPTWKDEAVAKLLRDGRPDLKGPLSQLGLDRQGRYWLVAAGRCNHNGFGLWGNDSIGVEAYNSGTGEPWPAVQVDAYQRGCAAICRHLGLDPTTQVKAHRETDPGRKSDPAGIDMPHFRAQVAALTAARTSAQTTTTGGFLMALTDTQQERLLALAESMDNRLTRLEQSVHGTTDQNRAGSVFWRVRDLHAELVAGGNLAKIRRLLTGSGPIA